MRTQQLFPHLKSLHIEHVAIGTDNITLSLAVQRSSAHCPLCHRRSRRVHSPYHRTLAQGKRI